MARRKCCVWSFRTSPRKSSSTFPTKKTNATARLWPPQACPRLDDAMNPYHHIVQQYADLLHTGKRAPFGGFAPLERPKTDADSPRALIFSPHPDDECIIGALPLRIMREAQFNVINVAVTQGSNKERQPARWEELKRACDYIGYG